ncbi:excinuclease ABC subunit UvrC [Carnimonas bestiolae]|uniref:excinuclease ABC subunit UvrC n=1 Tax=Carnimonas bestiolae TaxID=3402172 RepID=UPI003EDC8DD1
MANTSATRCQHEHFNASAFLKHVQQAPGVYVMYNEQQEIIYVGKAKRLRARLSSYFRPTGLNVKTQALVRRIRDIQVTYTNNETEALILEQTLIKAHRPPYNILLRDDKSYPYIYLSDKHPYPALEFRRVRQKRSDGRYFGPFTSSLAVRESLSLIQKIFRLRNCKDSFFANRSRPCLQYQIGRCSAPCVDLISRDDYRRDLDNATKCLEGKSEEVTAQLSHDMENAAAAMEFEKAAWLRDQIQQLRHLQTQQTVEVQEGDADVFAYVQRPGGFVITLMTVRQGRVMGSQHFTPRNGLDVNQSELLGGTIAQYYIGGERKIPHEIITSEPVDDSSTLQQALGAQAGRAVRLTHQVRGHRAQWQQLAITNANQHLASELANQQRIMERFIALRDLLQLDDVPTRLECFDISHSHGEATVASCVVFDQNGPLKSDYRRFNIEGVAAGDDYAAMRQALQRRYKRIVSEDAKRPDLLVIDGGKGQLNMAREALAEIDGIGPMKVMGVAKGVTRKAGLETLYLETPEHSIEVDATSPALHLLQHIRDESHRFAITGHRQRRDKARRTSTLQEIQGVGPKRRRELLRYFGGLQGVKEASRDDLAKVPGVSAQLAGQIHAALHGH